MFSRGKKLAICETAVQWRSISLYICFHVKFMKIFFYEDFLIRTICFNSTYLTYNLQMHQLYFIKLVRL